MSCIEFFKFIHSIPSTPDFPAVDSILYDPNDPDAVFKSQRMRYHPIVVSGLQLIQSWLKPCTLLAALPSKARPWRFIFIVPSDKMSTFELQKLHGDTPKGEWAEKVHQYVLGLEKQTIFPKSSDSSVQRAITSQRRSDRYGIELWELLINLVFLCRFRWWT